MFISYSMRIFLSNKSLFTLLALLILTTSIAWFLGQTAVIEGRETSLILMAEITRLFCILGPSFLLSSFLSRLQQTDELQIWIARPISRFHFIVENYSIGLMISLLFISMTSFLFWIFLQEFSFNWLLSLFFEGAIVLSVTLFFTLNLKSFLKTQILIMCLYFLGRLKILFLSSLAAPWLDYGHVGTTIFKILLAPLPNFSSFLTSPSHINTQGFFLETLLSCALFLALTHVSFKKKCL